MSTYVLIEDGDLPQEIGKQEMNLPFPNFVNDLRAEIARLRPGKKVVAINLLSKVIENIANKYDPMGFSQAKVPYSNYVGREYNTVEEFANVVCDLFKTHYPNMFRAALEYEIKHRPAGIKVIYYKGPFSFSDILDKNGLQHINERQVKDILETEAKGLTSPIK